MDTAQNTARAAAGRFGDRRLRGARRSRPTRHYGKARRTTHYWLFYTSRKGGGLYTTARAGWGSREAPLRERDAGGRRGGQRKIYAQGGTGEL